MPEDLQRHLTTSFGSIETFRDTLLATACASFGPSFTWLVQVHNPSPNHPSVSSSSAAAYGRGGGNQQLHFRIMTTYLAGSPYPGAHHRAQTVDMNTQNLTSATIARQAAAAGPTPANAEDARRQSTIQNTAGAFGDYAARGGRNDAMRFGGADVVPVLCVNAWDHVWMWDWGVSGKRAYVGKWYERIDWEVVWGRCEVGGSGGGRGGYQF
jgi:Fe-Mn family superoxide dismutase